MGKLFNFSKEIESAIVRRYEKHELVLMPEKDTVGVVLVGTLFALSHAHTDVMKPRLLFKCVEGHIIFHEGTDSGVTCHPETWVEAYEHSEVIFFKKEHF